MLRISCEHTKNLLQAELEIQKGELLEQLFFTSLEKYSSKTVFTKIKVLKTVLRKTK